MLLALSLIILLGTVGAGFTQSNQQPEPSLPVVTIGFVELEGDRRYEPIYAHGRFILKTRDRPYAGAELGIEDAEALKRVLKLRFALERMTVKTVEQIAPALLDALERRKINFFLIDLPAEAFSALTAAVRGRDVLLFNVSATEDFLRRTICAREVVHTVPSDAMSMDGLAQYLAFRKWRDILVLEGPSPADAVKTKSFLQSAKKFGGRIVAHQYFRPGTDPREREHNNPLLLSATARDFDVAFIADDAFDFARQVPYRLGRARPVVGSIDLEPTAWHWTWDHNGGPQVNSRFRRRTGGRRMDGPDWAAWISVKMVMQAVLRTRSMDFTRQRDFIVGGSGFDGDKGHAVSVRPWDHQVRQAILLAAPYQVVARAPVEGVMHRTNDLDTLGDDEPESPCRLNR
jgi:ABC transporter substrate binding protein (PQQ-dependent alcohol dehydrogenase system)